MIKKSAGILAKACDGNPVLTTATIMMFYVMLNVLLITFEKLVFGDRFEHWGDVVFQALSIAYAAYTVYACAVFNSERKK